jgi:PKD repeat protein
VIGGSWTNAMNLPTTPGASTLVNGVDVNSAGKVLYAVTEYVSDSGEADFYDMVINSATSSASQDGWGTLSPASPPDPNSQLGSVSLDGQGNGLVAGFRTSPTLRFEAIPLDHAGPWMNALKVPKRGRDDTVIRFSVAPQDVFTALMGKTKWTFGDGKTAFGNSVTHKYAKPGTYTVKATRTDALGNRTTVTRTIRIKP